MLIQSQNLMKKLFTIDHLTSGFFYLSILFFLIGFNFTDTPPPSGWYQQFMPNLGGRSITDIFFLDSLTGWSVTNATNQNTDTTYVLKTTNGGDNWVILYQKIQTGGGFPGYNKVFFLNENIGFTCGVMGFDKSTDGGTSWVVLNPNDSYQDMSILNEDTIWLVSGNPLTGGVFRTTNGGQNWVQQFDSGSSNPDHIYMFNARMGFISRVISGAPYMRKTTNGGQNWFVVSPTDAFTDISFSDSLTGWKVQSYIKKTTDGGNNWSTQTLPSGGNIITPYAGKISLINKDTLWANGGQINFANETRGMLYRTTNGGTNWLFQVPQDTSIHIYNYYQLKFINKDDGWSYAVTKGVHTVTGGNDTFYTSIKRYSSNVPKEFKLIQNFPNPFNPTTAIKYEISKNSNVRLTIYNITGKEVKTLVNQKQTVGEYQVEFDGSGLSSGVYFYRIQITNEKGGIEYVETKKAILIK
jgi:photosystem II stability/assembly factor-like uncharacterized protein